MKMIQLAALLMLGTPGVHAATPTLCKAGETTYFSCALKGGKVVSVCGSGEVEPAEGSPRSASWLQYRMGRPQALELVFPKQKDGSVAKFEGQSILGNVRINVLSFNINETIYSVESSHSNLTDDGFHGVKVGIGKKEHALPCRGEVTLASEFADITDELDPMAK